MQNKIIQHAFVALSTLGLTALLAGCSASFLPGGSQTGETEIGTIQGEVHGGQAPISGAEIFLFQTGISGYNAADTTRQSLLKAGGNTTKVSTNTTVSDNGAFTGDYYVTTGAGGSFNISGDYTCTPGAQVYLIAYGGNPGLSPSTAFNPLIMQMAGLGECPTEKNLAATVPYVVINEVSTVVFAYAMGGFGTSATNIGIPSPTAHPLAVTAIGNAMANVSNIFAVGTGQALVTTSGNPNSVVPASKIYALANILASCVNSSGSLYTGGSYQNCYTLMDNTVGTTGTKGNTKSTGDEAQAIFYMVHNPTANVSALCNLQGSMGPFPGTPCNSIADWTLPIVYKNAVSTRTGNIAFDSLGNGWISDRDNDAVVKVSPQGVVTPFTNLNSGGPNGSIYEVAVDPGDNVWALDSSYSQIYRLNTAGASETTITATTSNELSSPVSLSFNNLGTALVLNSGNQYISRFSTSGFASAALYNQTTNGQGTLGEPMAIAVDLGGTAFLPTNGGCACMGLLTNNATTAYTYTDYSGTVASSTAIAVDGSNNPWQVQGNQIVRDPSVSTSAANGGYQDANQTSLTGSLIGYYFNVDVQNYLLFLVENPVTPTIVKNGGLNRPASVAIDGNGHIWAANSGASTVSGFNGTTSLAGTAGFQTGSSGVTYAAAPDSSGNLWTVNSDGTVTQLLGLATPTATPVVPGQLGTAP